MAYYVVISRRETACLLLSDFKIVICLFEGPRCPFFGGLCVAWSKAKCLARCVGLARKLTGIHSGEVSTHRRCLLPKV